MLFHVPRRSSRSPPDLPVPFYERSFSRGPPSFVRVRKLKSSSRPPKLPPVTRTASRKQTADHSLQRSKSKLMEAFPRILSVRERTTYLPRGGLLVERSLQKNRRRTLDAAPPQRRQRQSGAFSTSFPPEGRRERREICDRGTPLDSGSCTQQRCWPRGRGRAEDDEDKGEAEFSLHLHRLEWAREQGRGGWRPSQSAGSLSTN